jgi:hypothetical protein
VSADSLQIALVERQEAGEGEVINNHRRRLVRGYIPWQAGPPSVFRALRRATVPQSVVLRQDALTIIYALRFPVRTALRGRYTCAFPGESRLESAARNAADAPSLVMGR